MRDLFAGAFALLIGASAVVGCGGSGSVDFFDASAGHTGGAANGGSASSASAGSAFVSGGSTSAGSTASAGSVSSIAGSGGMPSGPSDPPCSPVMEGMNSMSGPFGTLAESCWRVSTDISGWGCNNIDGRTIKVNGTTVSCAQLPLPDKLHGDYYFDFSAGEHEYASFFWF